MLAPVMLKPDKYVIRALLGSLLHLSCQNEFILHQNLHHYDKQIN